MGKQYVAPAAPNVRRRQARFDDGFVTILVEYRILHI
jgi:hypothetical protein